MILSIYGISGVGKNALCEAIEKLTPCFKIIDGASLMDELIPGGLNAFRSMSAIDKRNYRQMVVREIESRHRHAPYHTIVTGHYSFPLSDSYEVAWTEADGDVYDLIFCIEANLLQVQEQCEKDVLRRRASLTTEQLCQWQQFEIQGLELECLKRATPFAKITASDVRGRLVEFFRLFSRSLMSTISNDLVQNPGTKLSIFDCDKTLFSGDCLDYRGESGGIDQETVRACFRKRGAYCFESFFDMAEYYASVPRDKMNAFIGRCIDSISLEPRMLEILRKHSEERKMIFLTSGFPDVWEAIAKRYGLEVLVIGGNDLARSGLVVSNEEKGLLVERLVKLGADVMAFGDSMVDADMLKNSNQAVVVVHRKLRQDLLEYLKEHKKLSVLDFRENNSMGGIDAY
jgi:phosphoserine phosphatase